MKQRNSLKWPIKIIYLTQKKNFKITSLKFININPDLIEIKFVKNNYEIKRFDSKKANIKIGDIQNLDST